MEDRIKKLQKAEYKEIADKINRLAAKYGKVVELNQMFDVVNGRCIPNPFNGF